MKMEIYDMFPALGTPLNDSYNPLKVRVRVRVIT